MALREDHQRGVRIQLAHLLADPHPIVARQHRFEDHEVDQLGLEQLECLLGLRRGIDLVALTLEKVAQQIELKRILVKREDRRHWLPPCVDSTGLWWCLPIDRRHRYRPRGTRCLPSRKTLGPSPESLVPHRDSSGWHMSTGKRQGVFRYSEVCPIGLGISRSRLLSPSPEGLTTPPTIQVYGSRYRHPAR